MASASVGGRGGDQGGGGSDGTPGGTLTSPNGENASIDSDNGGGGGGPDGDGGSGSGSGGKGGSGGANALTGSALPTTSVTGGGSNAGGSLNNGNNGAGSNSGLGGGGGGGGAGGYGVVLSGNVTNSTLDVAVAGGQGGNGGSGGNGSSGGFGGFGGGGGGGIFYAGSSTLTFASSASVSGGQGGNGGNGGAGRVTNGSAGAGGGGGNGIDGSSFEIDNAGIVRGGDGGAGGNNGNPFFIFFGTGGAGGAGINGSKLTINNTNNISGGNGGLGGTNGSNANVNPGAGGAGIFGEDLTVINTGAISGGMSGDTTPVQADAITFTGGANSLTLGGTLSGNIGVNGTATTLTVIDSGSQSLGNAITGTGSVVFTGDNTGSIATVYVNGENTYSGSTTIQGTAEQLQQVGLFGSILNSKTISIGPRAQLFVFNGAGLATTAAVTTGSDGFLEIETSTQIGSLSGTDGAVELFNNSVLTTGTSGTDTNYGGTIGYAQSTDGSLTKVGIGTFTLSGTNGYTGTTTVSAGTLQVDGSTSARSDVTVAAGATLSGDGSVGGAGSTAFVAGTTAATVTVNGRLSASAADFSGTTDPSYGSLATGNLNLGSDATFVEEIGGTGTSQYDQVAADGTVNLDGTLQLAFATSFTSARDDSLVLIDNDGITDAVNGRFSNYVEGASITANGRTYELSYQGGDGNDVTLTDVTRVPPTYSVSISPSNGVEGTSGAGAGAGTAYTVTVSRSGDSNLEGTVSLTLGGTATTPGQTGSDYSVANGTGTFTSGQAAGTGSFTIPAGQASATFTITSTPDNVVEPDETVNVTLSGVTAGDGTIGTVNTVTATIINDDVAPPTPTGPTPGPDNLIGTGAANTISLLAGNDTYSGLGGADIVYGNQGRDLIYGNEGNDTVYGGQDDDRVFGGQGNDRLYGNLGRDTLNGNLGNDLIYGNEGNDQLDGGDGADTVYGGQDDDRLSGGAGRDVLYGNLGNDTLYGNEDRDFLYGGQGNDYLNGGDGPDVLVGGLGDDTLRGGAGNDRYVFDADPGARDLVLGFSTGEGDRLDLGGQDYRETTAANGDVVLLLSGGGAVQLSGINAQEFGNGAGYFVG